MEAEFDDYVALCEYQRCPGMKIPPESRIITSDDVFDYLLDIRYINSGIDKRRNELFQAYFDKRNLRTEELRLRSLDDYDHRREIVDAKRPNIRIRFLLYVSGSCPMCKGVPTAKAR